MLAGAAVTGALLGGLFNPAVGVAGAAPTEPVVRTTAIVTAPLRPSTSTYISEISLGLSVSTGTSGEVTIEHARGSESGTPLMLVVTESGADQSPGRVGPLAGVLGGDRLEAQIAVSEGRAQPGSIADLVALRVTDERTGAIVYHHGAASLLVGAPTLRDPEPSGDDASLTETTWGRGWSGTTVYFDNRPYVGSSNYPSDGVSEQPDASFVLKDRAHQHNGIDISTQTLDEQTGDDLTVHAQAAPTGPHAAVVITDLDNGHEVTSAG